MNTRAPSRTRTPEKLAADLADIIARLGPTKKCPMCNIVKPRELFSTYVPMSGNGVAPQSCSICRKCQHARTVAYRKRLVFKKESHPYVRLREANNRYQKTYKEKLAARLQAEEDAMGGQLSKKVLG